MVRLSPAVFNSGKGYGLFANVPRDTSDLHHEYYFSFVAKLILWASGKEPRARLEEFPESVKGKAGEGTQFSFTLSDVPKGCWVELAVRSTEMGFVVPLEPLATQGRERGEVVLEPIYRAKKRIERGESSEGGFRAS